MFMIPLIMFFGLGFIFFLPMRGHMHHGFFMHHHPHHGPMGHHHHMPHHHHGGRF